MVLCGALAALRPWDFFLEGFIFTLLTFSFPSSVRERLKPEFLVSALMALMAPDFTSSLACSVAVAVSTGGWSDMAAVGGLNLTPPKVKTNPAPPTPFPKSHPHINHASLPRIP